MSWSVLLMNLPAVANSDDIPEGLEFVPLGTREEVIARIRQVVPEADFTPDERVDDAPETDEGCPDAWRRWCEQIFLPSAVERCATARLEAS